MEASRTESDKPRAMSALHAPSDLDASVLVAVRTCLLAIALLVASLFGFYIRQESWASVEFIFVPLALLFGFCALSAIWIVWKKTGPLFTYTQFLADILIITGVVHLTGGPISPFIFLYLPVVVGAAILTSRRAALAIAALSLGVYLLFVWARLHGMIVPFGGEDAVQMPSHGLARQIIGLASAMVLVAVATSYLRKKLRAGHLSAEQSKKDLIKLSTRQRTLVEGISDGVIITAMDGRIASINPAACALFNVDALEAIGRKLPEICPALAGCERPQPGDSKDQARLEFELSGLHGGEAVQILYACRPITSDENEEQGTVCIFENVTKLRSAEEQLALQERMAQLLAHRHEPLGVAYPKLHEFVGDSPVMKKIFSLIQRIAASDANVLVSGESGTGKELAAKAIHLSGTRSKGPFVAINCGAVPENLIESQLFGHKKGSFTGADSDQIGLFQQAQRGTIFLDEIAELPLQLQSKLLRAIQERTIRPVGGDREIPIDVRIVSATNKHLKQEVAAGKFREDLYYRLNVVSISLPPLRERKEDLPLLVNSFLKRLVHSGATPVVPPATMQLLLKYPYPGNVRELENMLERALVLGGEILLPEHFPEQVRNVEGAYLPAGKRETLIIVDEEMELPIDLDQLLATIEQKYLEMALLRTNGAKKKAADLLGMNFRSFRYRLQKFGIAE